MLHANNGDRELAYGSKISSEFGRNAKITNPKTNSGLFLINILPAVYKIHIQEVREIGEKFRPSLFLLLRKKILISGGFFSEKKFPNKLVLSSLRLFAISRSDACLRRIASVSALYKDRYLEASRQDLLLDHHAYSLEEDTPAWTSLCFSFRLDDGAQQFKFTRA